MVTVDGDPGVLPVSYAFVDGAIVFATDDASPLERTLGRVAFEVDHVDEALQRGWSVLVIGEADASPTRRSCAPSRRRGRLRPWAPGRRDFVVRIEPDRVTGRITPQ